MAENLESIFDEEDVVVDSPRRRGEDEEDEFFVADDDEENKEGILSAIANALPSLFPTVKGSREIPGIARFEEDDDEDEVKTLE